MNLLNEVKNVGARSLLMVLQSVPLSICVGVLDNYGESEKVVLITLVVMLPFVIWMLVSMYKLSPYALKHKGLVVMYVSRMAPLAFIINALVFHTTSENVSTGIVISSAVLCTAIIVLSMTSLKSDVAEYYKKISKIKNGGNRK
ncbi:MAG: hypothetical protein ACRCX8_00795 [Sarcina sp.]